MKNLALPFIIGLMWTSTAALSLHAQGTIWNGPMISFTNIAGSDPTQPANADHLTDTVWLTRSSSQGLFNYFEGSYTKFSSPAGTEWALGQLANYASLTYTNWAMCYGGPGSLSGNIVGNSAILHLIGDDIYLAITFTSYGSGGGFAYTRSTPLSVPEPATGTLALAGLVTLSVFRRK